MLDRYLINLVSVSLQLQVVTITKINSNQCIRVMLNIQQNSINENQLIVSVYIGTKTWLIVNFIPPFKIDVGL